ANEQARTLNQARLTSSETRKRCRQFPLSILLVIVMSAKIAFATQPIAGSVVLWGQLRLKAGMTVTNMAAGGSHRLVLWQDGTVSGWGNSFFDQSLALAGTSNVIAVAAGAYHSVILKANGTVIAWGQNDHQETNVPPGLSNVIAIAAGGGNGCLGFTC